MQNIHEVRRENLRRFILDKFDGNNAAFSRAAGVQANQVNLVLSSNESIRRNIGEAFARRIESSVGLPNGWLDAPASALGAVSVQAPDVPQALAPIFRQSDVVASTGFKPAFLSRLGSRITSPNNLVVVTVTTRDMEPQLSMDDDVLIDVGTRAVGGDGVYAIMQGSDVFLRHLKKGITGGWAISGRGETVSVESLKQFKVAARVVACWKLTML